MTLCLSWGEGLSGGRPTAWGESRQQILMKRTPLLRQPSFAHSPSACVSGQANAAKQVSAEPGSRPNRMVRTYQPT